MNNYYEKDYGDEDDLYDLTYKSDPKNPITLNPEYNRIIQSLLHTEPNEPKETNIYIRNLKTNAYYDDEDKEINDITPTLNTDSNQISDLKVEMVDDHSDRVSNNINKDNLILQRVRSAIPYNKNMKLESPFTKIDSNKANSILDKVNKTKKNNEILRKLNDKQERKIFDISGLEKYYNPKPLPKLNQNLNSQSKPHTKANQYSLIDLGIKPKIPLPDNVNKRIGRQINLHKFIPSNVKILPRLYSANNPKNTLNKIKDSCGMSGLNHSFGKNKDSFEKAVRYSFYLDKDKIKEDIYTVEEVNYF